MEIKPIAKALEITYYLHISETQEYIMCIWEYEVHTQVCYQIYDWLFYFIFIFFDWLF